MLFRLSLLFFLFAGVHAVQASSPGTNQVIEKTVVSWKDTSRFHFLLDSSLYHEGWDTVAHASFWRDVINLSSDTFIINIGYCRKPIERVSRSIWMNQTEPEKICYKDSLSQVHCIADPKTLFVTAGKGEFYEVKKVLPMISRAVDVFETQNCDPWYAQTILLIESPGKNTAKSYVGATGPFQLMRSVAKRYGLRITATVDERTDLEKSAKAAAQLIKSSCIPYIRRFLDERNISYKENDLWFRLLVLHAYHAGAGNVKCVIDMIDPKEGGVDLIKQVWKTSCGGFKNESQNYSQIAIASLLNFNALLQQDGDTVFLVQGDKKLKKYSRKDRKPWDAFNDLSDCLATYEKDFIEGMMPYDYFMKRVQAIRKEFSFLTNTVTGTQNEITLKKYPASEERVNAIASELTKRRRYDDAIRMLKINMDMHPESVSVYDSLARAYRLSGDVRNADLYATRSASLKSAKTKGNGSE